MRRYRPSACRRRSLRPARQDNRARPLSPSSSGNRRFCFSLRPRDAGRPDRLEVRNAAGSLRRGRFSQSQLSSCRSFGPASGCSTEFYRVAPAAGDRPHRCLSRRGNAPAGQLLRTRYRSTSRVAEVLLLDPMLATGNSACEAASILKAQGARSIQFLCIVACPPGRSTISDGPSRCPHHDGHDRSGD